MDLSCLKVMHNPHHRLMLVNQMALVEKMNFPTTLTLIFHQDLNLKFGVVNADWLFDHFLPDDPLLFV